MDIHSHLEVADIAVVVVVRIVVVVAIHTTAAEGVELEVLHIVEEVRRVGLHTGAATGTVVAEEVVADTGTNIAEVVAWEVVADIVEVDGIEAERIGADHNQQQQVTDHSPWELPSFVVGKAYRSLLARSLDWPS